MKEWPCVLLSPKEGRAGETLAQSGHCAYRRVWFRRTRHQSSRLRPPAHMRSVTADEPAHTEEHEQDDEPVPNAESARTLSGLLAMSNRGPEFGSSPGRGCREPVRGRSESARGSGDPGPAPVLEKLERPVLRHASRLVLVPASNVRCAPCHLQIALVDDHVVRRRGPPCGIPGCGVRFRTAS